MQLIEVIPIARGIAKETLTYFSPHKVEPGNLVFVPLRNRTVPALVVAYRRAREEKAKLKASRFSIRKAGSEQIISFLSPAFMEAARETARYSASSMGAVLYALIPQPILENAERLTPKFAPFPRETSDSKRRISDHKTAVFQASAKERAARYRSIIREAFARGTSVFLVVPTIADAARMKEELSRGIEEYVFCLHGSLAKRKLETYWRDAQEQQHPVLIIGTAPFLSLFRADIATIILERERSSAYKLPHRPHLDMRLFAERYSEALSIHLILADLPLRIETLWRYKENKLDDIVPPALRLLSRSGEYLIDMREESKRPGKTFAVLGDRLKETLKDASEHNDRSFLFTARRGIAPMTICRDCGSAVVSEDGVTSMVLHKTDKGNVFLSHRTGEMRGADERCRFCKSWRLEAIGIGVERVCEAVAELIPQARLFRVDHDTTKGHRQIRSEVKRFYQTPGSILIGTELVIPYLTEPIGHSAVVSADSLLSLSEWRVTERVFAFILTMREITRKTFLIQTRKAGERMLAQALSGNIGDFYRDETALRKEFGYPPFSTLVKLSVVGTHAHIEEALKKIRDTLGNVELHVYPATLRVGPGREARHALIRVPRERWPDDGLIERLRTLPPSVTVDVDPENLL